MEKNRIWLILANLVLVLFLFSYNACGKKQIIKKGDFILLELAPVDPRALMQGDYMSLNYEILNHIKEDYDNAFVILTLSDEKIGKFVRVQTSLEPLADDEYAIAYTKKGFGYSINANDFFFQEGMAEKYENAKYGGIKLAKDGNLVLEDLYNESLQVIK